MALFTTEKKFVTFIQRQAKKEIEWLLQVLPKKEYGVSLSAPYFYNPAAEGSSVGPISIFAMAPSKKGGKVPYTSQVQFYEPDGTPIPVTAKPKTKGMNQFTMLTFRFLLCLGPVGIDSFTTCKQCGDIIFKPAKYKRKFCSQKCKAAFYYDNGGDE